MEPEILIMFSFYVIVCNLVGLPNCSSLLIFTVLLLISILEWRGMPEGKNVGVIKSYLLREII